MTPSPITPLQQTFVEALLSGKNISEAATLAGIARQTGVRWMNDEGHPVRATYEKQRLVMWQAFLQRMAGIHEKALQAIDEALSEESPLALRLAAAKFIYQQSLAPICNATLLGEPDKLVAAERDSDTAKVFSAASSLSML